MSRKLTRPKLREQVAADPEWCVHFTPLVQDLEVCRRLANIPYKSDDLCVFNQKNHTHARKRLFDFIKKE